MKKLTVFVAALLMVVGFSVVDSQAAGPFCLDFDGFCDGLEVGTAPGTNQVTGFWRNTDCAGTDAPLSGMVFSGPFGYGAYVTGVVGGNLYGFFIDVPLDGTMDMYLNSGGVWTPWIADLTYTATPGGCPFADFVGSPGVSTTATK